MMRHWARVSCGMMGRTPDFLNVAVMSMAAASEFCGQNRPEFKQNIENYFEYIRENDLTLTHTLVNLQRSRNPLGTALEDRTDVALSVVKETDAGHNYQRGHGCWPHWVHCPTKSSFIRPEPTVCPGMRESATPSGLPCHATRRV